MAAAAFVERKFGPDGAYDHGASGPWRDTGAGRATVARDDEAFVAYLETHAEHMRRWHT